MRARGTLREKALSDRVGTVCSAIAEMIRCGQFELSVADQATLEGRNDFQISGWVFAYRVYESPPSVQLALLQEGLSSLNPRIREQVCDIVGDNHMTEIRSLLEVLFEDPEPFVAEAARYNHDMLSS